MNQHGFLKKGRKKAFPVEGIEYAETWRFEESASLPLRDHSHSSLQTPLGPDYKKGCLIWCDPTGTFSLAGLGRSTQSFESSWQPVGMVGCMWMGVELYLTFCCNPRPKVRPAFS